MLQLERHYGGAINRNQLRFIGRVIRAKFPTTADDRIDALEACREAWERGEIGDRLIASRILVSMEKHNQDAELAAFDALRSADVTPTHLTQNTQLNINFRPNPGDEELLPKVAAMLGIELPGPNP